jgi:hypothetical protein
MSKKDRLYYQCRFSQGEYGTIGWIEERGAVLGHSVELPELGGFWIVEEVWGPPMPWEELFHKQAMDRDQRKASDI